MPYSQWHILVVEDEFDSVQMISKILRFHGVEVSVARNGIECLEMLDHLHPTLIITDLSMPGMDGWQTLAAIRARPDTQAVPVVAFTAYHSVTVAEAALQAGFDAYYAKPVNARTFVASLEPYVRG